MENCSQWRVKYPKIKMCKKHSGVKWAGVEVLRSRQANLQQTVNFSHHYQSKHSKVNVAVIWRALLFDEEGRQETMKKVRITDMKTVTNLKDLSWNFGIWFHSQWHVETLSFNHHITCMHQRFYCSANNLKIFPVFKLLHNVMLKFFTETICERALGSRVDMEIRKLVEKRMIWPWNELILIVLSTIHLEVLLSALVVMNMMCNIWIQRFFLPLLFVLKVASVRVHCTLLWDFFLADNGMVGGVRNGEWKLKVMRCSKLTRKTEQCGFHVVQMTNIFSSFFCIHFSHFKDWNGLENCEKCTMPHKIWKSSGFNREICFLIRFEPINVGEKEKKKSIKV